MDGNEFDSLVRRFGGMASRRAAIAAVLASAVGATRIGQAAAKRNGRGGDVGTAACNDQGCLSGGVICLSGFGLDTACGTGGTACTVCGGTTPRCSPNTAFTGGSCEAALPCTPSQCQLAGACVPLTDSRVCGRFANGTCQQACGTGEVCTSPTSGPPGIITRTCVANTCSSTCSTGCCTGLTCNPGNQSFACGVGGGTCTNCFDVCGSTNNGCGVDPSDTVRKCQCQFAPPVETCGPSNCPNGCCRETAPGTFSCVAGNEKTACGAGGQLCQACGRKQKCDATTKICKRRGKKH